MWKRPGLEEEPSMGQRVKIAKREQVKLATGSFESAYRTTRPPESFAKRAKKSRPREISSRRPVPIGRERCLGIDDNDLKDRSVKKRFDPRFEEHCGDLLEEHVERNYHFVTSLREQEKQNLQDRLRMERDNEEVSGELTRMEEEDNRRKEVLRRKKILQDVRAKEKEAVKRGKMPYFLRETDLRKLEVEAKFRELKQSGGVKKYIEKRRRRLASKDRKLLPSGRNERKE